MKSFSKNEPINTFIKPSKIHGLGLFASRDIKKGERIVQGHADFSYYNEWNRYIKKWKIKSFAYNNGYCMVNHSEKCNTIRGKDLNIIATSDIKSGEEITENYNRLPNEQNPFLNTLEEFIFHAKNSKLNHSNF